MNKEEFNKLYLKYKPLMIKINHALLLIGLFLLSVGIGATYQASHDVKSLNESLFDIAHTGGILNDGTTYYYIGLYENRYNFSSTELINRTQCIELYGDK